MSLERCQQPQKLNVYDPIDAGRSGPAQHQSFRARSRGAFVKTSSLRELLEELIANVQEAVRQNLSNTIQFLLGLLRL